MDRARSASLSCSRGPGTRSSFADARSGKSPSCTHSLEGRVNELLELSGRTPNNPYQSVLYKGMSSSAAAPKEPPLLSEEVDVLRWRAEQFRQLGFNETEACELAASTADLGQARYLLGSGCPPHLALAILL
jgi:hypothetical protein